MRLARPLTCLAIVALGCAKAPTEEGLSAHSSAATTSSTRTRSLSPVEPSFQQSLDISAYAASLAIDGDNVYVLGSHGVYRLGRERGAQRWSIELGDTPALGDIGIVYWLAGELRRAPKLGGESQVLATVPATPRRLLAAGRHLVWEEAVGDESLLKTLAGSEPKTIHRGLGSIEALALQDDRAYFVERYQERWRIGAVALTGGEARYTERRQSRTPALLATAGDVFFYDGPSSTVRRVASDLLREDVVARDVICSPLAVADRLYCAQSNLLFEQPRDGGTARLLVPKRSGPITTLAATHSRVAWLLDAGDGRAVLEVLER